MSSNRGGGGHQWTYKMSPSAFSLAAFKVSIARRGTAFTRFENIIIHG
jgi:hypothetical protein